MATLFNLPAADVLFTMIFGFLEPSDIWRLRLVCKHLYVLCWDYFSNVCTTLTVITVPSPSDDIVENYPAHSLGMGPGIYILKKCKKIRNLEIISPLELSPKRKESCFLALLIALVANECALKKLRLRGVDFGDLIPLLSDLSPKCSELEELELCDTAGPIQRALPQLMAHSADGLLKLSIIKINQSLTQPPLPIQCLGNLKIFSVACCQHVSSEGCMEELFRKCPLLEEVDLRQVQSVTDRTLLVLKEYCGHLKLLFVEGCPLVNMEPLVRLRDRGVYIDVTLHRTDQNRSKKIPGQI